MTPDWKTARPWIAQAISAMCDKLVATWERQADVDIPTLSALPPATVVEPIRTLFADAATALGDDTRVVPGIVAAHATQRMGAGLGADVVAREYMCMRRVLLDVMVVVAPAALVRDATAAVSYLVDAWTSAAIATCMREVEHARERLVAILAHDLRTPITCISMASEMLAEVLARDPHTASLHGQIVAAADRMERMVAEVLDLARRQDAPDLAVAARPDDLGAICRSVVSELATANPGRPIELTTSGDLRGHFDRDRVAQAVSNLVRNAIEHGIGMVHIAASEDAELRSLVLDVTNMRAANASGALRALARRSDGRFGLGLYIVHKIAAAHGATCTHESTGVKTTYTIRWPRVVERARARDRDSTPPPV